jgi:hypothetical protein
MSARNFVLLTSLFSFALAAASPRALKNVVVYKEPGRYAGWPANHGIWIWGTEILVGFETGYFKFNSTRHSIDWDRPAEHVLARSLDGGETWSLEKPPSLLPPPGIEVAGVKTAPGGKQPVACPGGIDFTAPGFALTARMASHHTGPSRFYASKNRGHSWSGPFTLPDFGQKGIAARTDYLVNGPHDLTLFLTAAKSNSREGRGLAARTQDGAKTWSFVSFIGPEPPTDDYAIMPSSVRVSPTTILTAIRHTKWIELWRSDDDAKTWRLVNRPAENTGRGNPPSMVRLRDGRIAITWGFRAEPYGIKARLSSDNGATWSPEIVLRADAGAWDIGYTRTVQRPDSNLVTIYYYNDDARTERYIGATIWNPGE